MPTPIGPSLNQAAAGLAAVAIVAKIAEDECDDVGVRRGLVVMVSRYIGAVVVSVVVLVVTTSFPA